jgi:hypothetical protein
MVEGIIGFSDMLSIAQTIGIVGTMVLTLLFSKKQRDGKELAIYRVESNLYGTFRNLKAAVIKLPKVG